MDEPITTETPYTPKFQETPFEPPKFQETPLEQIQQEITPTGHPGLPSWTGPLEQFLRGESPYDPVINLKKALTAEPKPGEPSVFGKTIDDAMRSLTDVLLPGNSSEALLQGGTGYVAGKIMPVITDAATRAFRATRPLAREIADEAIGKALTTPAALQAEAFYKAADASGKTIPFGSTIKVGTATSHSTQNISWKEAQDMYQNLKSTAKQLSGTPGTSAQVKLALEQADSLANDIEKVFPGFKATQKGYARINNIERIQQLVGKDDPLSKFELDLRQGTAVGPNGQLLKAKSGGPNSRYLNPAERKDVLDILEKLGKNPGDSLFQQLAKGRAVTGAIGGLLGFAHGGYVGGAEGMAAGVLGPKVINYAISQLLKHPSTRAFFKRSMEQKGGFSNPNFWRMAGALGSRLGMDIFNPPPEVPQMPAIEPPMPMEGQ